MKKIKQQSKIFYGYEEIRGPRADDWENQQGQAYNEYRQKWINYPKELYIPEFPLHIDIESSSYCNLLCPMCGRTIYKKEWRPNRHLDFEIFKKCIDQGAENGLCSINMNNVGEPLLNPKIVEMVEYASKKGLLDIFFHTNGVKLTKDMSSALIKAGLKRLVISIDSADKERYEEIRVGAKFEEVIKNVRDLYAARKELVSDNPLTRINVIRFPDLTSKGVDAIKKLLWDYVDIIGFLDFQEYNEKKLIRADYPDDYCSPFICPMLFSRLAILENGQVVPCCVEMTGKLNLGNVSEQSLLEIWQGEKLDKLRKIHKKGHFYKIDPCKKCDWAIKQDLKLGGHSRKT
jgi:radical SAM protein with 4Fe4S-binding SPASM domain